MLYLIKNMAFVKIQDVKDEERQAGEKVESRKAQGKVKEGVVNELGARRGGNFIKATMASNRRQQRRLRKPARVKAYTFWKKKSQSKFKGNHFDKLK